MGSAIAVQGLQLIYAVFTSRLIGPAPFGTYSIALMAVAAVSLLGGGGVGAAVARTDTLTTPELRGLVSISILLGLGLGLLTWIAAPAWSRLWGSEDASEVLRVLSVSVVVTPLLNLALGLARQRGRFSRVALVTGLAQTLGLGLGAYAVWRLRSPSSLAVAAVAGAVFTLVLQRWMTGTPMRPGKAPKSTRSHVAFAGKELATHAVEYLGLFASQLTVSRACGTATLGLWSRATTFAQVPIVTASTALSQVLYPELGERADLRQGGLRTPATVALWGGSSSGWLLGAGLLVTIPLLLGSEWELAGYLSLPLAVAAGLQFSSVPLTAALQASANFKRVWGYQTYTTSIYLVAAVCTWILGSVWPVTIGYVLVSLARLILSTRACVHLGFLVDSGAYFVLLKSQAVAASLAVTALLPWAIGSAMGGSRAVAVGSVVSGVLLVLGGVLLATLTPLSKVLSHLLPGER